MFFSDFLNFILVFFINFFGFFVVCFISFISFFIVSFVNFLGNVPNLINVYVLDLLDYNAILRVLFGLGLIKLVYNRPY
jgi:hypothetical protein